MTKLEGNNIPISTFIKNNMQDGTFMHGTTSYEKRGIAVNVPEWIPENVFNVINVHLYVLMLL